MARLSTANVAVSVGPFVVAVATFAVVTWRTNDRSTPFVLECALLLCTILFELVMYALANQLGGFSVALRDGYKLNVIMALVWFLCESLTYSALLYNVYVARRSLRRESDCMLEYDVRQSKLFLDAHYKADDYLEERLDNASSDSHMSTDDDSRSSFRDARTITANTTTDGEATRLSLGSAGSNPSSQSPSETTTASTALYRTAVSKSSDDSEMDDNVGVLDDLVLPPPSLSERALVERFEQRLLDDSLRERTLLQLTSNFSITSFAFAESLALIRQLIDMNEPASVVRPMLTQLVHHYIAPDVAVPTFSVHLHPALLSALKRSATEPFSIDRSAIDHAYVHAMLVVINNTQLHLSKSSEKP